MPRIDRALLLTFALACSPPTAPDSPIDDPPAESVCGSMAEPDGRGYITITFDDGFAPTFDHAYPVLAEHGLAGNIAAVTGAIGRNNTLSVAQLDELHAEGWSVVSHSVSHPHLPDLSEDELRRELEESRAWIEERGYCGASVFIVPFHNWGERERRAILRRYAAARGDASTHSSAPPLPGYPLGEDRRVVAFPGDAYFETPAGRDRIRRYAERVVDGGHLGEIYFHTIDADNAAYFRATIELLEPYHDRVRAYHRLVPDES